MVELLADFRLKILFKITVFQQKKLLVTSFFSLIKVTHFSMKFLWKSLTFTINKDWLGLIPKCVEVHLLPTETVTSFSTFSPPLIAWHT